MKKRFLFVLPWLVIVATSLALSRASGLSLPATLAIVVVALAINGAVATLEDDLPGGFNNPDGSATPSYVRTVGWIARAIVVLALLATFVAIALTLN